MATDTLPTRGHAAKRLSILDAGARAFCREGYAGANIDMIAAEAGVSRQTVYNHYGDKDKLFAAVVTEITQRCNARSFEVLASFPDQPTDLEKELTCFAERLIVNCLCDQDGKFLRKLIQREGERHPHLFASWRNDGPGKVWSALAARFARLAYAGYLDMENPDVAARQFLALVNAELQMPALFGEKLENDRLQETAACAVKTFLRAYRKREMHTKEPAHLESALRG
ncbi:TetR/AcrR family transcriptional regulator [uncultured Nitratireductor sp.]|uniref:TetR/AcrR family transcriptional regulator n=1 Tax=uncultured Nitratireductor sp. TaxID=520953 RepID=UPI0025FE127A|nr:TetR/AcrR family transcriptional regulator [uncultured Nitratireductor sp.]